MKPIIIILFLLSGTPLLLSCESEQDKEERIELEEQQKAAEEKIENIRIEKERADREKREETLRIENEKRAEEERERQLIYDKFIKNSLSTGATPYFQYYGGNSSCVSKGCSQIKVRTSNSDVLVIIKNNDKVVRHGYIQAGNSYSFSLPNGTYQPFFYYGKGWNPEKDMKDGQIKGGFIENEQVDKDGPQTLYNNILTYELILQQNGNFSTKPSNLKEAL